MENTIKNVTNFNSDENVAASKIKSKSTSLDLVLVAGEHNLLEPDPDQMR